MREGLHVAQLFSDFSPTASEYEGGSAEGPGCA
jgi:hypothetical protein